MVEKLTLFSIMQKKRNSISNMTSKKFIEMNIGFFKIPVDTLIGSYIICPVGNIAFYQKHITNM